MEENTEEKRFTLEGSVHGQPKSQYVQDKLEQNKRRPRILIAVLSTFCLALFIWAAISQYQIIQNKKAVDEAKALKALYGSTESSRSEFLHQIDSLEKENLRLQKNNDILSENTADQDGIFFEIQIGQFVDFNMNQYLENLANLRQEQHDGKNYFLLGRFRSFNKAVLFENDLKRIGIKNAFLVGRIDGKLVTYQEALDESKNR